MIAALMVGLGVVAGVVAYQASAARRARWSLLKLAYRLEAGDLSWTRWCLLASGVVGIGLSLPLLRVVSGWTVLLNAALACAGAWELCKGIECSRAVRAVRSGRAPWPLPRGWFLDGGSGAYLPLPEYWYGVCRACRGLCGPLGESDEPASTALARLASSGWDTATGLCPTCRQGWVR